MTAAARPAVDHVDGTDSWNTALAGDSPLLDLPFDRPRPAVRGPARHTVALHLGADACAAQLRLAHAEGAPPSAVAVAGYAAVLAHLTRQRDLLLGAAVGSTVRQPLRISLADGPTLRELTRQVRDALFAARPPNPIEPGGQAAQRDNPTLPGAPPLFQAGFRYAAPDDEVDRTTDLDLVLRTANDEPGLVGQLSGAADLFERDTVARFAALVQHLMVETATAPDTPVLACPPLAPPERDRVLHGLNRYARPEIGYTTMAGPFEEQVRRTPDAEAVVSDAGDLTYAELNARANQLGRYLRRAGARPGAFVAVSMERSTDLLVALYAVAKSGAGYVPVDPELPAGRMRFMLEDCAPVTVLTDSSTRPRVSGCGRPVLAVDADAAEYGAEPTTDLPPYPGDHLIHLLYTSGTTGRPKAVAYPVDGALADIFWLHGRYPFRPGDTAILKTSYGFDVSIWEIFWPLYAGARIAVCPPGAHRDPARLRGLVERYRVRTMFMVPTMMPPFFANTAPGSCPSLRWLFCGGEPVTPRVRDGFHERFPAAEIINCYGPTELGCVAETVLPVQPGAPVVVGPPPAHRRVYVVNDDLEPTPIGVAGELFVGGEVGVAHGYHRRSGLTATRFVADPFGPGGGRMYRTGDLVRYRADGVLEHLGRIGRQVKIRGMRIELAEIEAVLAEHEDVDQAVVTVRPDRDGEIAAFVVPAADRRLAVPALLAHTASLVLPHMLPSTVTIVDRIPIFVHDKIDFEALLHQVDRAADTDTGQVVAPATALEAQVHRIYCELLDQEAVGVTESLFVLGGHSLTVVALVERCAAAFRVELSITDVLAALSVRELAATLAMRGAAAGDPR